MIAVLQCFWMLNYIASLNILEIPSINSMLLILLFKHIKPIFKKKKKKKKKNPYQTSLL